MNQCDTISLRSDAVYTKFKRLQNKAVTVRENVLRPTSKKGYFAWQCYVLVKENTTKVRAIINVEMTGAKFDVIMPVIMVMNEVNQRLNTPGIENCIAHHTSGFAALHIYEVASPMAFFRSVGLGFEFRISRVKVYNLNQPRHGAINGVNQ